MFKRQLFICSAIEKCRENANCCPHKTPHIKDERCVPRQCRYASGVETIDCDPWDPANPRAPVVELVGPAKTVEQRMKEFGVKDSDAFKPSPYPSQEEVTHTVNGENAIPEDPLLKDVKEKEETGEFVPLEEAAEELDIKESVKKKAQKKVQGQKKGKGS